MRFATLAGVVAIGASIAACDDPPKTTASAAPSTTAAPAETATTSPKPTTMPELLVDAEGPYIDGKRADLAHEGGLEKLQKSIAGLPINGNPVTLIADKKAKPSAVAITVAELGKAGAPKVTIKTEGRGDLPKEITVVPESKVTSPAACSVASMVLKDLSTAIWPLKGGTGKRQRKGLAGPDLTHTGDELEKELAACDSPTALVSGEDGVDWENVFNLAGTVVTSDKKKRIETLVLPRETPVAGRPITLSK